MRDPDWVENIMKILDEENTTEYKDETDEKKKILWSIKKLLWNIKMNPMKRRNYQRIVLLNKFDRASATIYSRFGAYPKREIIIEEIPRNKDFEIDIPISQMTLYVYASWIFFWPKEKEIEKTPISKIIQYGYKSEFTPIFRDLRQMLLYKEDPFHCIHKVEFIENFACEKEVKKDVIRIKDNRGNVKYCVVIDKETYAILNEEENIWKYYRDYKEREYIKKIYNAFQARGIVLDKNTKAILGELNEGMILKLQKKASELLNKNCE